MSKLAEDTGFTAPEDRRVGGLTGLVGLAAVAGLLISTVVALTAITVGVAHASVADGVVGNEGSVFTIALVLGLLFIAIGGISLLPPSGTRRHRH
jgi:hypothetical protein